MESSESGTEIIGYSPIYPSDSYGRSSKSSSESSSESKSENNIVASPSSQTALLEAKLRAIKEQLALQRELDVVEQRKAEIVRKLSAYTS